MIKLYKKGWFKICNNELEVFVNGWIDYQNKIYKDDLLLNLILVNNNEINHSVLNVIKNFNGNFSIIVKTKTEITLIVDRLRTLPLLYFISNNDIIITDDIIKFKEDYENIIDFELDTSVCEQYLSSNFIIGYKTIFKNKYSVQAGEVVKIKILDKSIFRKQYFRFKSKMSLDLENRNFKFEAEIQDKILISVFNRMIKSKPNVNNWIIPLSGGYDSRVIVNYLYKLGVKNVICYSYGINENIQSEISREVAESLGYKWFFIDYKIWESKCKAGKLLDSYLSYGFNGNSVPHLQDFIAVYALKEQNIINNNDVFVPGHTLDMIAGGHLNTSMQNIKTNKEVLESLYRHYCSFGYYINKRPDVLNAYLDVISKYEIDFNQKPESNNWQERQTKFIVNSIKLYEFFGFDWSIPLWDNELVDYWSEIGFNYRYERNLFKNVFKNYLVVDPIKNTPFANDLISKKRKTFKESIINITPFFIKKKLKKKGIIKSSYYVNEGSHLIYSSLNEKICDYLSSFESPEIVKRYLNEYNHEQLLSDFEVNVVSTLLNLRKSSIKENKND